MCELFGFSGNRKTDLVKELTEFYSHAPENPHGWGLYLDEGKSIFCNKEAKRADLSDTLKRILSKKVIAMDAIAHIRLATIGYDEMENTHPFMGYDISGREWILAHNGTVFEGDVISKYLYEQYGDTDSERIFLYLIDRMNEEIRRKKSPLDEADRFRVLEEIVSELSLKNKLNLIIFDGDVLYVHTNYRDSLFERQMKEGVCFSTKPLRGGVWENVPFTRLVSYKNGVRQSEGMSHGNEYIPDQKSLDALYLAYAGI